MIRPLKGESFTDCKAFYWSLIHTSQDLIKVIQKHCKDTPLAREVINQEREIIKNTYAELKELQRWWEKEGKAKVAKNMPKPIKQSEKYVDPVLDWLENYEGKYEPKNRLLAETSST